MLWIMMCVHILTEPLLDDKEARKKIDQLRTKYNNLRKRLCHRLHKEGVSIMDSIRETLASLCSEDLQYHCVYEELTNEQNVKGFFTILDHSLVYLDFDGLLDRLVQNHGNSELKKDVESYRADLLTLLSRTSVRQAANPIHPYWPAQHSTDIPKNFVEVKTRILENPRAVRLIDLIGYRMRFTSEVRLSRLLFLVMGIKELNSYTVSWLVPSAMVPLLSSAVERIMSSTSFFQENQVASMSVVTEQTLYAENGTYTLMTRWLFEYYA